MSTKMFNGINAVKPLTDGGERFTNAYEPFTGANQWFIGGNESFWDAPEQLAVGG